MAKMSVKPGTGAVTQHGINRQNERGAGVGGSKMGTRSDTAYAGDYVNKGNPRVKEANPAREAVKMAPKINEGTGGQPDGAKRVINTEGKPAGKTAYMRKSTFNAPRSSGGGSATDLGYTKLK